MSAFTKFITRNPQTINRSMEFPEDAMTPPMGKSPIDAMQDHLNFNSFLANERDAGNISGEEYNILGGYDVSQTMSPGNPIGGMALNLGGGTVYNTLQGLFDTEGQPRELVATPNEDGTISYTSLPTSSQKFGNIPGTVARNTLGASGLISNDLKQTYEDLRAKFENREPQNITNFNLVDAAGNLKDRIGNFFFAPAYAPEVTDEERKSIERQSPSFRSLSDPEVYGDPEERKNLLERILELGKGLGGGILDAAKGAGNVLSNLGIVGALRNFDNFKNLSPIDQQFILSQAGGNRPMKDKYGYNIRSARGNYAQLVKDRANLADMRKRMGKPIRAIDRYYLNKEKERQAALQKQIQESISEGRSMQQSYEDHFSNMGYSSPAERAADTPTGTLGRI